MSDTEAQGPGLFGQTQAAAAPEPVENPVAEIDPFHKKEFLASEFLLWLWYRSEVGLGGFDLPDGPIELWFDNRMSFLAVQEEKVVSTFAGGAPSLTPEAKLSILSGKYIQEARIGLRRGEGEWSLVLRVKNGEVRAQGIKIPGVVKDGIPEMVYERMFLIDMVNRTLEALFRRFFDERCSPDWTPKIAPAMQRWLMGED